MPLLSIVLPTKNRYEYLFPVLDASIQYIAGSDYEIVVQDNTHDNSPAIEYFLRQTDPRIKYFHSPEPVDIVTNTNRAIMNSTGKYLVFIGDDDFVSPYILDIVGLIDSLSIQNLTYSPGNYYWPGVQFAHRSRFHRVCTMQLYKSASIGITKKKSSDELDRVLAKGGCYYLGLPRFYHGILSRNLLERIKSAFGGSTYFPGPSPDMSISVAIALTLDTFHYMHYPITITGVSPKSTAGMGSANAHFGRLEDRKSLPARTLELWDVHVPRFWTAYTIYAQSIHEVLSAAGSDKHVDYATLYAFMTVFEKPAAEYLLPVLKQFLQKYPTQKKKYREKVALLRIRKNFIKPIELLKRWHGQLYAVHDLRDISACMNYLLHNCSPR